MDSIITPKSWGKLTSATWRNSFKELIALHTIPGFNEIKIYMPFVVITTGNSIEFKRLKPSFRHAAALQRSHISILKLFMREDFGKRQIGIEIEFPGEVVPQRILRSPMYYYVWTKDRVKITKLLGTTDPDEIENQCVELMMEAMKFYLKYCTDTRQLINRV